MAHYSACAAVNEAHYKIMICFDSIKHDICIALHTGDIEPIKSAAAGDAKAQNDLASLFFFKKTSLKVLFIGWNWRQSNTVPVRCNCWALLVGVNK
jgi:hypothetical protein